MTNRRTLSALVLVLASTAFGATAPEPVVWPAPKDVPERVRAAGLEMLDSEAMDMHIHTTLKVYSGGRPVTVPADIGIDRSGPKPRYSPLHTHDTTGTLHVESEEWRDFTLGQFMTEWGVSTAQKKCRGDVGGRALAGDPSRIVLRDGETITLRCR
ncbi:hypothetical protein GCM10010277_45460 [Streptomyces longisporoflavus]|uniref:hypothetical protein n=1 Tax=Streptomyces longisporoflavus TaxID=28044 RepID=UPI00167E72F7|nr:hypothetical protein [Streptomyces longisporoflavus]GGV50664.1 hypothetical protein GCM10010277_45460 [Streptomyces longisporoflavus]